jgi:hypothetical protein
LSASGADRRAELSAALDAVRSRIERGCRAAGRRAEEVELVAVTKTYPASDVALLLDLGLRRFGENRPQEAAGKVIEVVRLRPVGPAEAARWHLVGRLQRNKARSVAAWAARVESVDSVRLADTLGREAVRAADDGDRDGPLPVLLQVSLDGDPARGGAPSGELLGLAERVGAAGGLRLDGVMAVAPRNGEPERAFAQLAAESARLRGLFPHARVISAGMTSDLERAIEYGSTCVRVGTALLGDRRLASP